MQKIVRYSLASGVPVVLLMTAGVAFAGPASVPPSVTVPEPGTLTLIAFGLGGLVAAKFRGRN